MSQHTFQTEVSQLLHLIIHSLYSHSEIFVREIVSNASDALDKLKYLNLTDDEFKSLKFDPRITIKLDEKAGTITFIDNGIGMNQEDLVENLGTIARSGTKNFLKNISGDAKKDSNLIGQFGVGFYSAFMVADKIEVVSKKAGEDKACKWISDGKTGYDLADAEKDEQGTEITLFVNEAGKEYASAWKLKDLVKKYSNHIAFPIFLDYEDTEWEGEGDDRKEKKVHKNEQINNASALWKKSKSELKDEDYNEFYKTFGMDWEDPLLHIHTKAEGTLEYTTLFFIPKKAPFDLYQADYKPGVKLYVKRVFITDDEKELMPTYLRFLRGVIDSEDLPLNVSREILQQNKVLASIKNASVKKVLSELKNLSEKDEKKYDEFIQEFNRPLKEGLYSDYANRDTLLELVRFKSTSVEGYTSLASYKDRMPEDQKAIYYITGDKEEVLRKSPLLEAYKKKGLEVLIMNDDIDDIVIPSIGKYNEIDLKAINKSDAAEDLKTEEDKEKEKEVEPFIKQVKDALGERVKDVVASNRLTDSPSCIIMDANDPSLQMQQMMKAMGQSMGMGEIKPILEINPNHDIVLKIKDSKDKEFITDVANLLLDQAFLAEGAELKDPTGFVTRLNRVIGRAL
ncbi:molecular chaperone HtpG [Spirochaeta cellobiosiphila]|uniref:molecular chaperone HtpG n=1 Tax=Spirochaeta cellobiosiphila TaxID=504483 RepID=UPI0003FB5B64|nr:molecular chaperone HtpG [Spirochaeta cellobiosiphila]